MTPKKAPELPIRTGPDGEERPWHERTIEWWEAVWRSPVADEYLPVDLSGLHMLAELEDALVRSTDLDLRLELSAEIRLWRQAYGLTPVDRRRLQSDFADLDYQETS